MTLLDDTHRADLQSWVESAQSVDTDFPIQNLPLGIFRSNGRTARPGVAIGSMILDLLVVAEQGMMPPRITALIEQCAREGGLNAVFAAGRPTLSALRARLGDLLRIDSESGQRAAMLRHSILLSQSGAELLVPARIGDYTDFYASINHATNVGSMFRPDNPLLPISKWVPIGYHGRASSIVPSGTAVRRPHGQTSDGAAAAPTFGPTKRLDYELEIGAFIGAGNNRGEQIGIEQAESHVAGLCMVNDWSARDVQAWEYQPLGPFLAKNFATTVSPWVVSLDALAPFRAPSFARDQGDPAPLPYLFDDTNERTGGLAITLEVLVSSATMREQHIAPRRVSLGSFTSMYWTVAQLVAHHASNGCNLQPGDLLASGTVSGDSPESRGCLLERTARGSEPLTLPTGEIRRFLEDGDEVIMHGWCERDGFRRIGFGECRGIVLAA